MERKVYGNSGNMTHYEVEFNEWERVNRGLKTHGLATVEIAHPAKIDNKSDTVIFECEMSKRLRDNFLALMSDCERRQELVQELISTNNQLREELKAQTVVSERYETRVRELKLMLDTSKIQVEDMQEQLYQATNGQSEEEEKIKNTYNEVKSQCKQLQKQCNNYETEVDRLSSKLKKMHAEEQKRASKQRQALQHLKQRPGRGQLDDKVLDLVDSYERQIYMLQKEVDSYALGSVDSNVSEKPYRDRDYYDKENEGTPQYKELIKSYEKQLKEAKKKEKTLENDIEMVKLELQGRPELKDYRTSQTKLKKLERLMKKHNLSHLEENAEKHADKKYSTLIDDIDNLPLYHCRRYLKNMCDVVGVFDLNHIVPKLEKHAQAVEAYPRLHQFALGVLTLTDTAGVPGPPEFGNRPAGRAHNHQVWCEKSWHHVMPTLQYWVMQLKSLKELQLSINKLSNTLLPWRETSLTEGPPTTTVLIDTVDAIIYEEECDSQQTQPRSSKSKDQQTSRAMLQGVVDHFMNLFDVVKVTGCYARMNDIYTKLGETHNILKTLRDLLGLNKDAKSALLVDSVARLCEAQNRDTYDQLKHILPMEDIDSIVRKIGIYEEFFPVFQDIMKRLMDILDVTRIDQVVPQVRSLKLLADSFTSRR